MNYAAIKKFDVANGIGVRVSLFVSGCTHHCKGCFNEEAWDFNYGEKFTDIQKQEIIEALSPKHIKGFSLLGGEPFEPENRGVLCDLLKEIKATYPDKTVWCYSGYLYDSYMKNGNHDDPQNVQGMLDCIDILVDGKFVEELKDINLLFKGSSNQRIIDVKASEKANKVILWENENK